MTRMKQPDLSPFPFSNSVDPAALVRGGAPPSDRDDAVIIQMLPHASTDLPSTTNAAVLNLAAEPIHTIPDREMLPQTATSISQTEALVGPSGHEEPGGGGSGQRVRFSEEEAGSKHRRGENKPITDGNGGGHGQMRSSTATSTDLPTSFNQVG